MLINLLLVVTSKRIKDNNWVPHEELTVIQEKEVHREPELHDKIEVGINSYTIVDTVTNAHGHYYMVAPEEHLISCSMENDDLIARLVGEGWQMARSVTLEQEPV